MKTNPTQKLELTEDEEKVVTNNSQKPYEPTKEDLEDMEKMVDDEYPFDEEPEPTFEVMKEEVDPNNPILVNCKPVYNFQSMEFSLEISPNNPDHLGLLESIYNSMLQILMRVSVDQPGQKPSKPAEPLATEKQKKLMDGCKIKYKADCTVKEAQALIDEFFGK